jgi:PPOX class probable F420-dependent enzyme
VDHEAMRGLLAGAPVGRLATVSADGLPHAVPACFVLVGDVVYTAVDHKPKRSQRLRRIENIRATAAACLLVDFYAEDWSRLWWVRLDGTGRVVTDGTERTTAITALRAKYPQYAQRPPDGPVLALDVRRWSGWSAT